MADTEDKEKAEKLAAAKKRYEQMKKAQKGKKGGARKKDEKADESAATESKTDPEKEDAAEAQNEPAKSEAVDTTEPAAEADSSKVEDGDDVDENVQDETQKPKTERQLSLSSQSRQRSESFRKQSGLVSPSIKTPGLPPLDSESEVQEVYRKQAARIEELERENKNLKDTQAEDATKLSKTEEELEKLREGSGQMAELRSKASMADDRAKEIERLNSELTSAQRQLTQAQQSAATKRRQSTAGLPSDLSAQLASKTSTIESLELELSNLRNQVSILESDKTNHETTIRSLENRADTAETSHKSAQEEIEKLKSTLSSPSEDTTKAEDEDTASLNRKISVLQSDLRTAQSSADNAVNRATSLEQKIEALTKLHREASTTTATRDKEIKDLKHRIKSLTSDRHEAGGEDLSDLEDEEREKLQSRIRDLEAENFELRRGVWRDKRQALQPELETEGQAGSPYEEVDLNSGISAPGNPFAQLRGPTGAGVPRQSSTFTDVLQSGISAFTGRDSRARSIGNRGDARRQSLGLLSEDGFDEDAFRVAQEEEGKKRIERVKEVKRGLEQWRGWRVDIADLRAGGLGGNTQTGPVFEA